MRQHTLNWIHTNVNNKGMHNIIIIYAMRSCSLYCAQLIKRHFPNSKVFLIVPDLPQYMDFSQCSIRAMLKRIDYHYIKKYLRCVDGYILYSAKMAEFLQLTENQWMLMPSIIASEPEINNFSWQKSEHNKICLYAGTLSKAFGIETIIEAFLGANVPASELHIYGAGEMSAYVQNMADKSPCIKYHGFKDPSVIKQAEQNANLLLNVRDNTLEYTKYSCPSKLIEYMSSGTPVLSVKLEGVPQEYYKYIYTIDSIDKLGLANMMTILLNKGEEELNLKGSLARAFVNRENNYLKQTERIIDFIKGMMGRSFEP